jgi:hypothetical protein
MSRVFNINALVAASAMAFGSMMLASPASGAARIVIINGNAAGVGFNDTTPVAPVGGNPGTTRGQQRLIAFQHAANLWGLSLDSTVEIRVFAQFTALGPNVLGSAGPWSVFSDFGGAPGFLGAAYANTWYHSALADKRAGADLAELEGFPGEPDIGANFSSDFNFYLGIDNNHGAQIDLVAVVLHELGHGLGFSNLVNETTGANLAGQTDVYSQFTLDTTNNTAWSNFATNAQRAASALRVDKIVWNGPNVTAAVPYVLLFGRPEINVNAPASLVGSARVGTAAFGPAVSSPGITSDVVVALDPIIAVTSPSATDGCSPLTNAAQVAGKIALVDRGTCAFTTKVKNAQNAGAIGVIVANNAAADPPPGMAGVDATITIPSILVAQTLGAAIKARLAAPETVNVNLGVDLSQRAGTDTTGFAQVFATNPVQTGSSISHYDSIAFKNQLMEPAINPDLTHEVIPPSDMTLALMRDIGWYVDGNLDGAEDTTFTFGRCTTNQPDVQLPNGAMLADQARVWYRGCSTGAKNHGQFVSCVAHTTNSAVKAGLISGAQKGAVQQCAAQANVP